MYDLGVTARLAYDGRNSGVLLAGGSGGSCAILQAMGIRLLRHSCHSRKIGALDGQDWGDGPSGRGKNRLGELLMQARDELREDVGDVGAFRRLEPAGSDG